MSKPGSSQWLRMGADDAVTKTKAAWECGLL
jgi:hypothetical protein